jgi:hypothetical protein
MSPQERQTNGPSVAMWLGLGTVHPRVEAGSNISTVTLRVVGGDEKGSLNCETVKYGRESQGTQTREKLRFQGSALYIKDSPVLSSEKVPHKNRAVTVKQ